MGAEKPVRKKNKFLFVWLCWSCLCFVCFGPCKSRVDLSCKTGLHVSNFWIEFRRDGVGIRPLQAVASASPFGVGNRCEQIPSRQSWGWMAPWPPFLDDHVPLPTVLPLA